MSDQDGRWLDGRWLAIGVAAVAAAAGVAAGAGIALRRGGSSVRVGPRLRPAVVVVNAALVARVERETERILKHVRFVVKTRSPKFRYKYKWRREYKWRRVGPVGIEQWPLIDALPGGDPLLGGALVRLSDVVVHRIAMHMPGRTDYRYEVYDGDTKLGASRLRDPAFVLAARRMAEIAVEYDMDPGRDLGGTCSPERFRPAALPRRGSGSPVRVGARLRPRTAPARRNSLLAGLPLWEFDDPEEVDAFPSEDLANKIVMAEYQEVLGSKGFVRTLFGYIENDSVERVFDPPVQVRVRDTDEGSVMRGCDYGMIDPYWNVKVVGSLPSNDILGRPTSGMRSFWIYGKSAMVRR